MTNAMAHMVKTAMVVFFIFIYPSIKPYRITILQQFRILGQCCYINGYFKYYWLKHWVFFLSFCT